MNQLKSGFCVENIPSKISCLKIYYSLQSLPVSLARNVKQEKKKSLIAVAQHRTVPLYLILSARAISLTSMQLPF